MTTAALRAVLVVAAVVVGVFVLSRAFAPGGEPPPAGAPGPTVTPTPSPEEEPPPEEEAPPEESPEREPRQEGVVIDVLNGTPETGLADATAGELEDLGYEIRQIGNAARNYDETTIFFRRGARPEAEHLASLFFEGATLDRMQDDANSEAELIVVLGFDFANG